jgi:hypothetical protein
MIGRSIANSIAATPRLSASTLRPSTRARRNFLIIDFNAGLISKTR